MQPLSRNSNHVHSVLEELRTLETESAVKDEEHYAVRESLQERLAHYEKELLKIRHHVRTLRLGSYCFTL